MTNETQCRLTTDLSTSFLRTDANIPGVVVIILFYGIILAAGILSPWLVRRRQRTRTSVSLHDATNEDRCVLGKSIAKYVPSELRHNVDHDDVTEEGVDCRPRLSTNGNDKAGRLTKVENLILAGRDMGVTVGSLTLAATNLGGGMLNGTAQALMDPRKGLVWCQAPVYYAVGFLIAPFLFVDKMRQAGHRTMVDPIQASFGRIQTSVLCIPPLLSDLFWSTSILTALGYSLSVIIGMNFVWAVVISEAVSILYTFTGGLYSVAYTDIVELACLLLALCVSLPFAMIHPAAGSIWPTGNLTSSWVGSVPDKKWIAFYIDEALTLTLGGSCWQCYYQRVLAQRTVRGVYLTTFISLIIFFIVITPVVMMGAVAFSTDWNLTDYRLFGEIPVTECDYPLALPMVMRYLTPVPVAVIGLGAISAAVMSSTDSAALSTASLVTLHIYSPLREVIVKSEPKSWELQWIMRMTVIIVGVIATTLAINVPNTYGFLVLAGDVQYLLFPHLVAALHAPFCNTYGSMISFGISLLLRLLSGEHTINLPAFIRFPYYDSQLNMQMFPFRTCIVIFSVILMVSVSLFTSQLAKKYNWFRKLDNKTLQCFVETDSRIPEKYQMCSDLSTSAKSTRANKL